MCWASPKAPPPTPPGPPVPGTPTASPAPGTPGTPPPKPAGTPTGSPAPGAGTPTGGLRPPERPESFYQPSPPSAPRAEAQPPPPEPVGPSASRPRGRARSHNPASGNWGPFRFCLSKSKNGAVSWQATCKFHRDEGDPISTVCSKSRKISDDGHDKEEVLLALKHWCLAGMGLQDREEGHKKVQPEPLPQFSGEEIEAALPGPEITSADWNNARLPPNNVRDDLRAAAASAVQLGAGGPPKPPSDSDADGSSSSSSNDSSSSSTSDSD